MKIRDRIVELRRVKAGELLPNPKNWRTHPEAQQNALRGLLAEVGIAGAVLARETEQGLMLIDGHLRADVDPNISWPVLVLDVTEAEADKLLASIDPLASMAETDEGKIASLLAELNTDSQALQDLFDSIEPQEQEEAGEVIEDEAPEPPADPITQPGDLWLLGKHRLLCGDSTMSDDVSKLLVGSVVYIVVTDPPYGMNYVTTTHSPQRKMKASSRREVTHIVGDDHGFNPCPAFDLVKSDELFVWGGDWLHAVLPAGGSWIVWDKRASEAADSIPGSPFEICWSRERHAREFIRLPWGGWNNKEKGEERHHPTQKPVECMARIIRKYGNISGAVYDPFIGSGTTLIAAEQLGRVCYGMEISPAYCDVIVARWEKLTGEKAVRG